MLNHLLSVPAAKRSLHRDLNAIRKLRNNTPINVLENDKAWTIQLLAPGYEKSEIHLNLEERTLNVTAETKKDDLPFTRKEFSQEGFKRSFKINPSVDHEKISADLSLGILTIILPKAESAKPKEIKVN